MSQAVCESFPSGTRLTRPSGGYVLWVEMPPTVNSLELFDRALAANPSSAFAWLRSSPTFSYIGETREARRRAEIGLLLSPYDAHVFFTYAILALASYADGD